MAFTQVSQFLTVLDGKDYFSQPISMAGANGVHVEVTQVAVGGAPVVKVYGQTTNDLENWKDLGGTAASGGSAPFLIFGGSPDSQQAVIGSGGGSPFNTAIGSAWFRLVFRSNVGAAAAATIAASLNTYSG